MKPPASPAMSAPSIQGRGMVFHPPSGSAFAPYLSIWPPRSSSQTRGCSLKR